VLPGEIQHSVNSCATSFNDTSSTYSQYVAYFFDYPASRMPGAVATNLAALSRKLENNEGSRPALSGLVT